MRNFQTFKDVISGVLTRRRTMAAFTLAAMITVTGCGTETPAVSEGNSTAETDTVSTSAKEETTSVAVSKINSEVSPARQETKPPAVDTSPEDVCRLFMKYLNSGDRIKAEHLLTSVAFDTTAKAGLYLQPMGSHDAKVVISPAFYVTNKQQLAHVECSITEIENGEPVKDELTWMVRKGKSGWRIFGMLLTLDGGKQDFLSLENAQDVDVILQMSGQNVSEVSEKTNAKVSLK